MKVHLKGGLPSPGEGVAAAVSGLTHNTAAHLGKKLFTKMPEGASKMWAEQGTGFVINLILGFIISRFKKAQAFGKGITTGSIACATNNISEWYALPARMGLSDTVGRRHHHHISEPGGGFVKVRPRNTVGGYMQAVNDGIGGYMQATSGMHDGLGGYMPASSGMRNVSVSDFRTSFTGN